MNNQHNHNQTCCRKGDNREVRITSLGPGSSTVAEAAALLGCHRNTIYRYVATRRIPAFRVGDWSIRIPNEALDNLRGAEIESQ